jgi:hypothetical protein
LVAFFDGIVVGNDQPDIHFRQVRAGPGGLLDGFWQRASNIAETANLDKRFSFCGEEKNVEGHRD